MYFLGHCTVTTHFTVLFLLFLNLHIQNGMKVKIHIDDYDDNYNDFVEQLHAYVTRRPAGNSYLAREYNLHANKKTR